VSRAQAESNKNTSKSGHAGRKQERRKRKRSNAQHTHPLAEARVVPGTPSRSRMPNCQSRPDQGSQQEQHPRKKIAEIPETRLFHMQKCPIHVSHYAPSHAMHQKRTDCLCLPALSCGPGGDCPKNVGTIQTRARVALNNRPREGARRFSDMQSARHICPARSCPPGSSPLCGRMQSNPAVLHRTDDRCRPCTPYWNP
jgi:hypothetical protein